MQLLRELPGRLVWREGDQVVKAFQHPSRFWRWRDRLRARRELDVLARLHALGLPVPQALGIERRGAAWCARLAWIDGARSALELCERNELGATRAAAIGRTVASFHCAGLDQPDWHLGNLLVDAQERVFAIDFHKARLAVPSADVARRDAAVLGAHLRERVRATVRRAAFDGWWEALAPPLRAELGDRRDLLRALVDAARRERRRQVERDLDRWLRPSGAAQVERGAQGPVVSRRDSSASQARFELRGEAQLVRAAWLAQARCNEHRIPAARPLVLEPGRARFDLAEAGARSEGAIERLVADRALTSDTIGARSLALQVKWTAPDGTVHLVPRGALPL